MFYLSKSIVFEGRVPILRVPEGGRIDEKWPRRGLKNRGQKKSKNHENHEMSKKVNLNEVPRIPHGFDVFSCVIYKKLEKQGFRNIALLRSEAHFWEAKMMSK